MRSLTVQQIGAACVYAFAQRGVENLILADIQQAALEAFEQDLQVAFPAVHILSVVCNVTDETSVDEMVRLGVDKFGRIDFAVNSAGITNKSLVGEYATQDVSPQASRSRKWRWLMLL